MVTAPVLHQLPPNYEQVLYHFGDVYNKGMVMTYWPNIYAKDPIPDHLMRHEMVHMQQQCDIGGPEIWWDKYVKDKDFRLSQEIPAYQAEYEYIVHHLPKRKHWPLLMFLTSALAKGYGFVLTTQEACDLITKKEI